MRKYAIEFDGEFRNCDTLKINDETIEEIIANERTKVLSEVRKNYNEYVQKYGIRANNIYVVLELMELDKIVE